MKVKIFLLLFLCFLSISVWVEAQVVGDYRSNVTTGTWHTPGSWQRLASVGPENWVTAVAVPPTTAGLTITIRSGHTITLATTAGTVTLSSNLVVDAGGNLVVNNSNNAGADLTISATGSLTNNGGITISGTTALNAQLFITNGGAFTSNGSLTISSFGNLRLSNGTTNISGTFANNGVTGSLTSSNGTVQFSGTSTLSGTPITNFSNITVASGTLTISLSTLNLSGNFNNNGTVSAPNTISVSGNFVNSGTYNLGTALTLNGTSATNNFTNDGTFNPGTGTVSFSNTFNVQSIDGASATAFYNLSILNPNGVLVENTAELSGTLTLGSGSSFDADGASDAGVFTVRSTSLSAGGRIATIPGDATFMGNVTIERFVNGPASYRYFSIPIVDGKVSMWQNAFPVTGNFSNPSPAGNGVTRPAANAIFTFDPATNLYVAIGSGAATEDTDLSNTAGYAVYTYTPNSFTISVRGTLAVGDIPVPVSTDNGGYNLVPNPYASAIDWDNVTKTGLNNAMWVRVSNNNYAAYVGGVATNAPFGGWTGEVSTGQSFWIQSTSASSLDFKEADKTAGQNQFMRQDEARDYMRITLVSPLLSGSVKRDEAVIRFAHDALEGIDGRYDARKLKNSTVNLSTFINSSSEDYAINGMPLHQCEKTVKLRVEDVPAGNYKLEFSDLDKMDSGYEIKLIDKFLNQEVTIEDGQVYNFTVTSNVSTKGADRFELKLKSTAFEVTSVSAQQNCGDGTASLVAAGAPAQGFYRWYESQAATEGVLTAAEEMFTTPVLTAPKTYFVSVVNNSGCESALRLPVEAVGLFAPDVTVNGNILSLSQPFGDEIHWYKGEDEINGATAAELTVNETGTYKATVMINGCLLETDAIQFVVNGIETTGGSIIVYPNPTPDYLSITGISGDVIVYVYDSQGRLMAGEMKKNEATGGNIMLDFRQYQKGLYLVNLKQQDQVSQFKVLKK